MKYESEKIEFKQEYTPELYKEVIAFANTDGGTIYIGVDNNGNVVGVDDLDESYTRITNGIRDSVLPDVTVFVKYTLQDNDVIKIDVAEGASKPYYLKSKGPKPSGVFIRHGASSVQASMDQIRRMIKISDGDIYESMRSVEQELTFDAAERAFKKYRIDFSEDKFFTLGICGLNDEIYTNVGLLLSDQCSHTIKTAVFADERNTVFKDSREFSGSILQQLEDAFSYLMLCNRNEAEFRGLERIEHPDYPQEAMREALLNAIVHRDYSYSGSIIVNVNDKSMEFISLGGLLPGLSADDIRNGISQPRNKKLAEVFHRLRLIESYGTGIRKIFSLYADCAVQPEIVVTENTFKIILPNMNTAGSVVKHEKISSALTPQMQTVIDYLNDYGEIRDDELQELLGIKRTRAYVLAKQMISEGLITAIGRGTGKKYVLNITKECDRT